MKKKNSQELSTTEQIEQIEKETKRKRFSTPQFRSAVSFALALVLLVSSSAAYFTDYAETTTTATAGTVKVSLDDSGINLLNPDGKDILNPGDMRDFEFTIKNEGNKSVDTEVIITLTSSVPMKNNNNGIDDRSLMSLNMPIVPIDEAYFGYDVYSSEYELYWAEDIANIEGCGHYPKYGTPPLEGALRAMSPDMTTIVYTIPLGILSGNDEFDEYEKEYIRLSPLGSQGLTYSNILEDLDSYYCETHFGLWYDEYPDDAHALRIETFANHNKYAFVPDTTWEDYIDIDDNRGFVKVSYLEFNAATSRDRIADGYVIPSYIQNIGVWEYDENYTAILNTYSLEEFSEKYDVEFITYEDESEVKALFEDTYYSSSEYTALSDEIKAQCTIIPSSKTYDLVLLFDPNASNDFQNSNVSIEIELKAKQHRNTDDDVWLTMDTVLNAVIQDQIFTVEYNDLHQIELTGVKNGVDLYEMTEITIPAGVESIPEYFFYGLENLEKVTLPSTMKSIGVAAFEDCYKLTDINLVEGITYVGQDAFCSCSIPEIVIPGTLIKWQNAFSQSSVKKVIISEGITTIDSAAFSECYSLMDVTFPSTLKHIENFAFNGCDALSEIELPEGLISIGEAAFRDTILKDVVLPTTLRYIDYWGFSGITTLESIVLPEGDLKLEGYAFNDCSSLMSITTHGHTENYVNIREVCYQAFAGTAITNIALGPDVEYIDSYAFSSCSNLKDMAIMGNKTERSYQSLGSYVKNGPSLNIYTDNQGIIKQGYTVNRERPLEFFPLADYPY